MTARPTPGHAMKRHRRTLAVLAAVVLMLADCIWVAVPR